MKYLFILLLSFNLMASEAFEIVSIEGDKVIYTIPRKDYAKVSKADTLNSQKDSVDTQVYIISDLKLTPEELLLDIKKHVDNLSNLNFTAWKNDTTRVLSWYFIIDSCEVKNNSLTVHTRLFNDKWVYQESFSKIIDIYRGIDKAKIKEVIRFDLNLRKQNRESLQKYQNLIKNK